MGDPHYNTWGGKNNSWGNKNRKGKDNKSSQGNYEPNKLFAVLVGGIWLYLAGALGWSLLSSGFTAIKDALGFADDVKSAVEYTVKEPVNTSKSGGGNSSNSTNTSSFIQEKVYDMIKNELELSEEDVRDVLNYLTELHNSGNEIGDNVVILEYEALESDKTYKKQVLNRLEDFKSEVTFVFMKENCYDTNEAQIEAQRVKDLVTNNIDFINDTIFTGASTGGAINRHGNGVLTLEITFFIE